MSDKPDPIETVKLIVRINGTDTNYWARYGFKQNPFPQTGVAEFGNAEIAVNSLDGDPVKSRQDIIDRLPGFAKEFVNLCIDHYKRGERTEFAVIFPRNRP